MPLPLSGEDGERGGFLDRLQPSVKLAATLLTLCLVALVPVASAPWFYAGLSLVVLGLIAATRTPWRVVLRRLLWLEPLVAGLALSALLQPGGRWLSVSIFVKSTLSLLVVVIFSSTTPWSDLLRLLRRLRVPDLFVTILALTTRYLDVFVEETARMRRARASRTFGARRTLAWSSAASVIGQLFVRSSERAERIYAAMCARGWR
ncbi:MAG: cobalt ECF transporter T component CbiQ [Vicinamibacterales bacterium]